MTERISSPKKALIVVMPWAIPHFPALGPALVRSILIQHGIECDILYGNLLFSRLLQADTFIERELSKVPICELAFTPYYFGTDKDKAARDLQAYVTGIAVNPSAIADDAFAFVVEKAGECIDVLSSDVPWEDYDVVGFSVMMQQTVAALALAKRIKARSPSTTIVFGGPNTARPMGLEMIRIFPEIDYILEGEVDATIAKLFSHIRSGVKDKIKLQGLLYRDEAGKVVDVGGVGSPFHDLNSLPYPDYLPFLEQVERHGLTHIDPVMPFETSRGCWWGQKHHCTFCGIDDEFLKYRVKTDARIIDEVLALSARHRRAELFAVDSIINHKSFKTLLPAFEKLREEQGYDFTFFFETKSNLKREHAQIFRRAGVNAVQPGIESFSDHVLKIMDKGTTAAKQIQCMKLLFESDVTVYWNFIFDFPQETEQDYLDLIAAVPFLHHLPALHNEGLVPVQMNRFAPYHNTPDKYGIFDLKAKDYYDLVFPDPAVDRDSLAFYFNFSHGNTGNKRFEELQHGLLDAIELWRKSYRSNSLIQRRGPGFVKIFDKRTLTTGESDETPVVTTLEGSWAALFSHLDEVRLETEIMRRFAHIGTASEITAFLDEMAAKRLVYRSPSGELINLPFLREARLGIPARPSDEAGAATTGRARRPAEIATAAE